MDDPDKKQFLRSYMGYEDWREGVLRGNWKELQRELGSKEWLFAEGNAPLYRDVAEPFDFTPTTKEPVTGQHVIAAYDPEYQKAKIRIQEEEFAKRMLRQENAPQSERYIADTLELKKNLKGTETTIKKLEQAGERQIKIAELRKAHPYLDALASEIESEAFKEFSLARESDNIVHGATLQNRQLTEEEEVRLKQIKEKDSSIAKHQAKIVKLLSRWDTKMKEYGLDPANFGGKKMGHLLSAPGVAADVAQIATIAGIGPMKNYDQTGATYTDDEVVEIDGVKRVRSEMEELAAYHPDNAKNHPEISDEARIKFFKERGQSERYLAELPGYDKWKSTQPKKGSDTYFNFNLNSMMLKGLIE